MIAKHVTKMYNSVNHVENHTIKGIWPMSSTVPMNFSTIPFLWFLAAFLTIYGLCPSRFRRYLLLLGSVVFMLLGTDASNSKKVVLHWVPAFWAALMAFVNYLLGIFIQRSSNRKLTMGMAVAINVMALVTAKLVGTMPEGVMPTGISFYTFAFITYLVDVGREQISAEYSPLRFANYSFFFPKFLMGPITRYSELGPELDKPRLSLGGLQTGLENLVTGFAMKVLIADKLAYLWSELTRAGFEAMPVPLAWLGAFSFSIQLYIEWQSYTLMAQGIAGVLGFKLPQNFNYPYLARSIGEYYRRWHMTLTRWFKDYVYIPLGGSRAGTQRTVFNILVVWLLTSLWHGLGWNFILWGMSLGLFIVIEKLWLGPILEKHKLLSHLWVLFLIPQTWVCFKIDSTAELGAYFSRLFPFFGTEGIVVESVFWQILKNYWCYLALGVFFCFPLPEKLIHRWGRTWIGAVVLAAIFWYAVYELSRSAGNAFMYLNF